MLEEVRYWKIGNKASTKPSTIKNPIQEFGKYLFFVVFASGFIATYLVFLTSSCFCYCIISSSPFALFFFLLPFPLTTVVIYSMLSNYIFYRICSMFLQLCVFHNAIIIQKLCWLSYGFCILFIYFLYRIGLSTSQILQIQAKKPKKKKCL